MIVGLSTDEKVVGTGEVVGGEIQRPNGNVYDQVLLEGNGAALTASPQKVTRISFIDLPDDIVQVEFSGAGALSLIMDNASTPTAAANYDQPGVDYVKGHAGIVITGGGRDEQCVRVHGWSHQRPINVGDIAAYDNATPVLVFGAALSVNITGGSLFQPNGQPVKVGGLGELRFIDGMTSQGTPLPAQVNEGALEEDGVPMTEELFVNP